MTETMDLNWDEVDVDETISEGDQAASEDISMSSPVGTFLCLIDDCILRTNDKMKKYSCNSANLKMIIKKVIKIEQVLTDEGKPVKVNGEIVKKSLSVPEGKQDELDALYCGMIHFDEVNLFHPKEELFMKKRRHFVAKKIGIMSDKATELKTSAWPGSVGNYTIVTTEWNRWKDKTTGEKKKNVRVAWDGYKKTTVNDTDVGPEEEFDI